MRPRGEAELRGAGPGVRDGELQVGEVLAALQTLGASRALRAAVVRSSNCSAVIIST